MGSKLFSKDNLGHNFQQLQCALDVKLEYE